MRGYTDDQKRHLLDLIAKWQQKLRLRHWRIEVAWDKEPDSGYDGCLLEVHVQTEIHYAEIRVGDFYAPDQSDTERENAVCHELIHIHAHPLWETVEGLLGELGSQARAHVQPLAAQQLEQMVDALATSFVPFD